jgi:hypothetical protein
MNAVPFSYADLALTHTRLIATIRADLATSGKVFCRLLIT